MGKLLTFIIGFIICAAMVVFWSGFDALLSSIRPDFAQPATPAETQPPPTDSKIEKIKEWSGSDNMTTEIFTITEQPWAIGWANNPEVVSGTSIGYLQITVNDASTGLPISVAANTMAPKADQSNVYQEGTFYLTINAANTQWAVQVWARQ